MELTAAATQNQDPPGRRPLGVWIICTLYSAGILLFLGATWFNYSHVPWTASIIARVGISICLLLAFATQLFRLRKTSFHIYIIYTVFGIALHLWDLYTRPSGLRNALLDVALDIVVLMYVWRLLSRSILR
jgi:hypothetical protein